MNYEKYWNMLKYKLTDRVEERASEVIRCNKMNWAGNANETEIEQHESEKILRWMEELETRNNL